MKKNTALLLSGIIFSSVFLSESISAQNENEEATVMGAIPLGLLEAHYNQCVSESKSMGKLAGSYCQCVSNKFYQNLTFQSYMRYTEGLRNHDKSAIDYKNKTTADCLAKTASHIGKPGLPF